MNKTPNRPIFPAVIFIICLLFAVPTNASEEMDALFDSLGYRWKASWNERLALYRWIRRARDESFRIAEAAVSLPCSFEVACDIVESIEEYPSWVLVSPHSRRFF